MRNDPLKNLVVYITDDGWRPALAVMDNTGPAYFDRYGIMVESGEYVAAQYESAAADVEWSEGAGVSAGYCVAARRAAEALYARDLEELPGY